MTKTTTSSTSIQQLEVSFPGYISEEMKKEYGDDYAFNLSGTLRMPSTSPSTTTTATSKPSSLLYPAAIVIHGSGPIDRDGNAIMPFPLPSMKLNTHNHLADYLVKNNSMVVLCCDKRGVGKSTSKQSKNPLYYDSGMMDLVYDVIHAYKYLIENHSHVVDSQNIFLIGHSEGAILLPLIVETMQKEYSSTSSLPIPKGIIFVSGFGETLPRALQNQQETILKEVQESKGFQGFILKRVITKDKLEKQHVEFMEHVNIQDQNYYSQHCGLIKIPTKWYREHMQWDTLKSLRECEVPMLALTGSKDVQAKCDYCEKEKAKTLAPNTSNLQTHIIKDMTHILRTTDKPASILNVQKDYMKQSKQPLCDEFLTIVSNWIASTSSSCSTE